MTGQGVAALTGALMRYLDEADAEQEAALTERISTDVLARSAAERGALARGAAAGDVDVPSASGAGA